MQQRWRGEGLWQQQGGGVPQLLLVAAEAAGVLLRVRLGKQLLQEASRDVGRAACLPGRES